jgi:hypothetical protein
MAYSVRDSRALCARRCSRRTRDSRRGALCSIAVTGRWANESL